jgi:hypothetical protein
MAGDNQSGGVSISGSIGSVGGDVIGGSKTVNLSYSSELDSVLLPLIEAIAAADSNWQIEAGSKLNALRQEVAKGKRADDGVIAALVNGLVGLVPSAATAVVSAFASPILAGIAGPVTKLVLDNLRGS